VLIHAGDLTGRGSPARTQIALEWLDRQPAKHVIFIAGNHDLFFQDYPDVAKDLVSNTRLVYLENSGTEIDGLKFWGSPYTPEFMDWAFMYPREDGEKIWGKIPYNSDVLITHGPPVGILDKASKQGDYLGCRDLYYAVNQVKPRIHVFGHIHGGYGTGSINGIDTVFYNASQVNEAYQVVNKPWIVNL
jgi:Icc-related predicted phosphoesterase